MRKSKAEDDHRTFLLASFLWLLCYGATCLIVVDPLQLNDMPDTNGVLMWLMLGMAAFAMGVALLWGVKELQRHDGVPMNHSAYPPVLANENGASVED